MRVPFPGLTELRNDTQCRVSLRKPRTDMNFRRSLPEIRCLSQGLPHGICFPFVVSPKRLSTPGGPGISGQEM